MKFAVVSDTHDNLFAVKDLVKELKKEKPEFIVHAGDVVAPFTLKEFFPLGVKIYIAFGNNDGEKRLLAEIASQKGWEIGEIVEFPGGVVYHGTDRRILDILCRTSYSFVVCGHTHEPEVKSLGNGRNLLNPGEVCGYLTGRRTYAICEDGDVSIIEF